MLNGQPITDTSYGTNPTSVTHGESVPYASTISREGYKTDDAEQSVTVAANATVTFENTRKTDQKWLGGETNKDNRFSAYTPPKTT